MLHTRFPRFNSAKKSRNRNLDNLHVIPTGSVVGPKPSRSNLLLCASPQEFYQPNKKKAGKRRERKRKREIKHLSTLQPIKEHSQYHWYNTDYLNTSENPSEENVETAECSPEAPAEDSYFEEVEVASYETEGAHEIPVGFRKSKVKYLRYKRNCFFKPKVYNFGIERTVVNCVNIQNNSNDIDIVSEAEYEIDCETDKSEKCESREELHTIAEENEKCEPETEEQIEDGLCAEKKNFIVKSGVRKYSSRIKNKEFDLYQDKSLDQNSLDSWKSHLIGLEYLIEVQNGKKDKVMNYHCVLCSDDLAVEGFPSICVINHINGYKHMVKYLEKHFPACGYRFDETSNHDSNIVLQKLCDVINRNLGYSFMCITNLNQYVKNKQKIVDVVLNAHHFDENSLKLDDELGKTVDSIVLDEVNGVLSDIIEQIAPNDSASSETQEIEIVYEKLNKVSKPEACLENAANQRSISKCSELSKDKSGLDVSKPPPRGKRSKSLASYLKLKHARARLTKPKVSSNNLNKDEAKKTPSENIVSGGKADQAKETPYENTSEKKVDCNNISQSKILRESDPSTVTTEEDKSEITMTVRKDKTRISKVSKMPKKTPDARQKLVCKIREKALQKQTMHSKHCLKTFQVSLSAVTFRGC